MKLKNMLHTTLVRSAGRARFGLLHARTIATKPTKDSRDRVHNELPSEVDVVVVGAGSAGLMTAASLATAGKKVAIFDGHFVVGGCASQFRRKGKYRYDVGLHYVGDTDAFQSVLSQVGIDDVEFSPMDQDGFDTLVFPGLDFRIPANHPGEGFAEPYKRRLLEHFPGESRAIDKYTALLNDINNVIELADKKRRGQLSFSDGFKLTSLVSVTRFREYTMGDVLNDMTDNMLLKGVIMGQNGDYGLPPSEVSVLLHCGLAGHYLKGGYYPKGGGQVMSDRMAEEIENNGGSVHLRRKIDQILVKDGKAVGVETAPRRGATEKVYAKAVVVAGDMQAAVNNLIAPEHLPSKFVNKVNSYVHACGLQMTFLAIDKTKDELKDFGMGVTGATNYWCFDEPDFDNIYRRIRTEDIPNVGAYITCASQKDPESQHAPEGQSTVEVLTMCSGDPNKWGVTEEEMKSGAYRYNPAYQEKKARLEDGMVQRLEDRFPGLSQHIVYRESATPITHNRYTHGGTAYGFAATPDQFLDKRPGGRSKHIAGLYFTGHNIRPGHGVISAMSGGRGCGLSVLKDMKNQGDSFPTLNK